MNFIMSYHPTIPTMISPNIAPPENLQLQSPLARLPAEIKHIVFGLCFQTDVPFVDPDVNAIHNPTDNRINATLGLALLQTCRRFYHECDRRPLFSQNRFRFTSIDKMRTFLHSLDSTQRSCIQDVEIDFRLLSSDRPENTREWQEYLTAKEGSWADKLTSLRMDAIGVKCVRLNLEGWPIIPMYRTTLWNFLRSLLMSMEEYERVVVVGASKGSGMVKRNPWSPVHFVGGDDVGADDLVPHLWSAVKGSDETKTIRWVRQDGKLQLEVASINYLLRNVDPHWTMPTQQRRKVTDPWPHSGSCSLYGYDNRNSEVTGPTTKGVNPSAAE